MYSCNYFLSRLAVEQKIFKQDETIVEHDGLPSHIITNSLGETIKKYLWTAVTMCLLICFDICLWCIL